MTVVCTLSACAAHHVGSSTAHDHGHHHGHHHGDGPLVHRFESAEQWAAEFDSPDRDAWQRPAEVVSLLALSPGMTVADIGAGTGYFEPHLSRAVGPAGSVLAVDVEADMVRYLRERAAREGLGNVRPVLGAFDDPGLGPSSVDRVLIVDTWHHIDARAAYCSKLRAALRPGGLVAIVDFPLDARRGPPAEMRVSAEAVAAELRSGGFEASIAQESLPEQYVVIGRVAP